MNAPHKVIYDTDTDTDPGVDDAIALYFALAHRGIDLIGITTTFGNVSVEQAATNALYLTGLAKYDVPVTKGVQTPWCKAPVAPPAFIHGAEGIAQGQTMLNRRDFIDYPQDGWDQHQAQSQVCMQVDAPACLALFEETLLSDWLSC